jgi:hypothetical protein
LKVHQKIGALGGKGSAVFEAEEPVWFQRYHYSFATGAQHTKSGRIDEPAAEIYGAGSFWRRSALDAIHRKGIEPLLTGRKGAYVVSGDDVEWCYLVQLAGYEIWYDEQLEFGHLMPSGRMKWTYYLQLKKGIAAGSALLFPYQVYLQQKNSNRFHFLMLYISKTMAVIFQWLRFKLRYVFTDVQSFPELQLAEVTIKCRCFSFFKNSKLAYMRFCLLKSVF